MGELEFTSHVSFRSSERQLGYGIIPIGWFSTIIMHPINSQPIDPGVVTILTIMVTVQDRLMQFDVNVEGLRRNQGQQRTSMTLAAGYVPHSVRSPASRSSLADAQVDQVDAAHCARLHVSDGRIKRASKLTKGCPVTS